MAGRAVLAYVPGMAGYLHPLGWLVIALAGAGGALAAIMVARVSGASVKHRVTARRLGLGILLFAPAPLLMGGAFGPIAAWLFLAVASATLARQGMGPLVVDGEGTSVPLGWGAVLTRGVALATGALLVFFLMLEALSAG